LIFKLLGTGTSQGVPVIACTCEVCSSTNTKDRRLRTSMSVSSHSTHVVIDTGPDFRLQMLNIDAQKLDAVLYTHEHNDHIAGLDDVRPFYHKQGKNIAIFGLPRVMDEIKKRFAYSFDENPYPGTAAFDIIPYHESKIIVGDIEIELLHVIHGDLPILGYKFGRVAYLTDINGTTKQALDLIKKCDILILDALHHDPHPSHFNLKQALEFVKLVKPKKTYLIHISHHMGLHDEINLILPKGVELAYDGLEIIV
jgi:phosphoribosyl 1,2-cyclic phosphate phosphodiesterase